MEYKHEHASGMGSAPSQQFPNQRDLTLTRRPPLLSRRDRRMSGGAQHGEAAGCGTKYCCGARYRRVTPNHNKCLIN